MSTTDMAISALAPWYGGNRTEAERPGHQLGPLAWCGVVFAGGMPELPHINTRAGVANDKHCHVINLARVVKHDESARRMVELVNDLLFHPENFRDAQARCSARAETRDRPQEGLFSIDQPPATLGDPEWAADYFVCCWMGRGGTAGQEWHFDQSIAMRWTASGGGSAKRWRSAVESIRAWTAAFLRWEFTCLDWQDFLDRVADEPGHGLYADPPWVEEGENYQHRFTRMDHVFLASRLTALKHARIVVRYGDHPLIRELYGDPKWHWIEHETRNQEGGTVREVMIVNGPLYPENPC